MYLIFRCMWFPVYMSTGDRPVSFRGAKRPSTCPPAAGRFPFGREVPVFMSTVRFTFGRPSTCPPVAGRFPFGRKASVYMPTGRMPVSYRAQSARLHAHRLQADFVLGAKRPCTCPPAVGRFTFGREAPVYMPTGRRPVPFRARRPVARGTLRACSRGTLHGI